MMKILGVDFGAARTGIAVSDDLGMMAHGICTVKSYNTEKAADEVIKHYNEQNASKIVLGLPKNMDNSIGERGKITLAFAELLKSKLNTEIVMWDERLTTVSATRVLNETNTRGKKRKNVIDTLAAEIILQNYLDSQK